MRGKTVIYCLLCSHCLQGKIAQAEIDRRIQQAVSTAFTVRLGGESGQQKGFGRCLAVQAGNDSGLGGIRSQLGNALAKLSGERGLRAIGLIAYREVSALLLLPDKTASCHPDGKLFGGPCLSQAYKSAVQERLGREIQK